MSLSSTNAHFTEKELHKTWPPDDLDKMKGLLKTLMVVAILIATVTFVAVFTMPGS